MGTRRRTVSPFLLFAWCACSEPFQAAGGVDASPNPMETGAGDAAPSDDGRAPDDAQVLLPVTRDLLLWLRADTGVVGSPQISIWTDQSEHHSDARQSNPNAQPRPAPVGYALRPAVVFDDDDFLSPPAGFGDFSKGLSMFAVAATDSSSPCVAMVQLSNGPEIDDIALGRHDGRVLYEVGDSDVHGDDFPLGVPSLASVVHTPDMEVALRLNGGPFATANFPLPATVTRLSNVVGRSLYDGCASLHGGISELLVYARALGNDERVLVETYLQSRWNCCR